MILSQLERLDRSQDYAFEEFPPDWMEEYRSLLKIVYELAEQFGDSILFRFYDPRSFQGDLRSLRYGVRRYPTFVVNGSDKIVGVENSSLLREKVVNSLSDKRYIE